MGFHSSGHASKILLLCCAQKLEQILMISPLPKALAWPLDVIPSNMHPRCFPIQWPVCGQWDYDFICLICHGTRSGTMEIIRRGESLSNKTFRPPNFRQAGGLATTKCKWKENNPRNKNADSANFGHFESTSYVTPICRRPRSIGRTSDTTMGCSTLVALPK